LSGGSRLLDPKKLSDDAKGELDKTNKRAQRFEVGSMAMAAY
jgi:hypothetical protein